MNPAWCAQFSCSSNWGCSSNVACAVSRSRARAFRNFELAVRDFLLVAWHHVDGDHMRRSEMFVIFSALTLLASEHASCTGMID